MILKRFYKGVYSARDKMQVLLNSLFFPTSGLKRVPVDVTTNLVIKKYSLKITFCLFVLTSVENELKI